MNYFKKTYFYDNHKGLQLFSQAWQSNTHHKASIFLVHGIGEHSSRYDQWAERFCDEGISVFAIDLRGHGLSEGKNGTIDHINDYLDDIAEFLETSGLYDNPAPLFVYGHSMGGNIALNLIAKKGIPFKGGIIASPWLRLAKPLAPGIEKLVKSLDAITPHFRINSGIKSAHLLSDSEEVMQRNNDDLTHSLISVRLFNQLQHAAHELIENPQAILTPLLFIHGESDEVTDPAASKEFALKAPNGKYIGYKNARHELHYEPVRDQVFRDIVGWINSLTKPL